jgi:hypothetical protein
LFGCTFGSLNAGRLSSDSLLMMESHEAANRALDSSIPIDDDTYMTSYSMSSDLAIYSSYR